MTFEERYGMTREVLLQEVRLRQQKREEARLAALTEMYRQARFDAEKAQSASFSVGCLEATG